MDAARLLDTAVADIRAFVAAAQDPVYVADFPYGTYTKPRPGTERAEPGRQGFRHAANLVNIQVVGDFVRASAGLDIAAPAEAYLPALERALVARYGPERFAEAKGAHRQPWRFLEGIGAFIASVHEFGIPVNAFAADPAGPALARLAALCGDVGGVVRAAKGGARARLAAPAVRNAKSQDLGGRGALVLVNASAGSLDDPDSGGVFGDPCYALTTQEEDIYRGLPLGCKLFSMFVLGAYYEAETADDRYHKFLYRPEYAPRGGRCLVIDSGAATYLFSAAHNCAKSPLPAADQERLAYRVNACAVEVCIERRLDYVGGAFGIGVFRGDAGALAAALLRVHADYSAAGAAGAETGFTVAYYIRDPSNEQAVANYNVLAAAFGCPPFGAEQ